MFLTKLIRPEMTKKFICAFSRLLWDTNLIASRFTLALAEFMWGTLLLWPGSTFDRTYYINMSHVFTEVIWGSIFIITSILQLTILLSNNLHSRFARIFAVWNVAVWVTIVYSLAFIYPLSASLGSEVALTLVATWILVRPYILAEGYRRAK